VTWIGKRGHEDTRHEEQALHLAHNAHGIFSCAPYRALVEGVASLCDILALCFKVREQNPLFQLAYQGQQALCRPNLRGRMQDRVRVN
jgi:hypothetical protein